MPTSPWTAMGVRFGVDSGTGTGMGMAVDLAKWRRRWQGI